MAKEKPAKQDQEIVLVKMVNPEGKEADVHPDEVENYKAADFKVI